MPFYECAFSSSDSVYVEDKLDKDGELSIVIENAGLNHSAMLSKENAKAMALHILNLLEESK